MKKKRMNCVHDFGCRKLIRAMKLIVFFLLSGLLAISAESYSQAQRINLNMKDAQIIDVFNAIEQQSEFYFFYKNDELNVNEKVDVQFQDATIDHIMSRLLQGKALSYKIVDRYIVISPEARTALIKQVNASKVHGKVTDSSGTPLPGVTIVLKGTTNGTIADANGNYSLSDVPSDAVLIFSFVGMKTQEVTVSGKTNINVTMIEETIGIDEVVAVGYGTERKGNITGSISSVKNEELTIAPVASTSNALVGRMPGLISLQSSGQPGADAAALSIRGFGGALVIVDGVESSFNNIDPNQIESVSILKDGSASIYGARAGNGVILITTKRGKDQKPTITLNSSYSYQGITNMPKPVNAGEYATLENEKALNQGWTLPFTEEQINKYFDGTDPQYPNTNWYKEVIRDWTPMQQHNLSIRGGSDKIKYYGFFGFFDQQSFFKKNGGDYDRYNLQSNIDAKVTDNLSIQLNISSVIDNTIFPWRGVNQGVDGIWQDFWNTLPIYPAILPDPTKLSYANGMGTGGVHLISNYDIAGYNRGTNQNLKGTFIVDYSIKQIKGLSVKGFINYSNNYYTRRAFTKPYQFWTYDVTTQTYNLAGALGSQASINETRNFDRNYTGQLSLNYDNAIGEKHHIKALALYEFIDYKASYLNGGRTGFLTPAIEQVNAGDSETSTIYGYDTEMGRTSFVGRVNYSFNDKYLVETILRADASAKFPANKRWGYFPSVSVGWRINKENFMQEVSSLDDLKLRASFGSSGLDDVSNFAYLSGYKFDKYFLLGSGTQKGLTSTGLANPDLTWEKINIYNLGTEFSLWQRRLYGEIDVFYRELTGIPATRTTSLPSTFGASLPPENINSQNTRGFDLMIGTSGKAGKLSYDVSGNLSWFRVKWDHYEEPDYTDPDQIRINKQSGEWYDRSFGYQSDGLFTSMEEIANLQFTYPGGNDQLSIGDIKYVDTNNDKVLDWRDQVNIGKGNWPHWTFGTNINLKYNDFDLSALFQGAFDFYRQVTLDHGYLNYPEFIYNERWTNTNNTATAMFPRVGGSETNKLTSDFWYKNASYVRLKTFSFGYNVSNALLKSVNIQQLRIYFAGTNLFTISKLNKYGVDPEAPSGSDGTYYPQQRTISLGLNLSF